MEPTSYRYCGVCGQPLEAGATVCGNCGAAVEPTADDAMTGAIVGDTGEARPLAPMPTVAMTAAGAGAAGARGRCRCGRRRAEAATTCRPTARRRRRDVVGACGGSSPR